MMRSQSTMYDVYGCTSSLCNTQLPTRLQVKKIISFYYYNYNLCRSTDFN